MGLNVDEWHVRYGYLGVDAERRSLPTRIPRDEVFLRQITTALHAIRRSRVGGVLVRSIRPYAVISHISNSNNYMGIDGPMFENPAFTTAGDVRAAHARGATVRSGAGDDDREELPPDLGTGTGVGSWALMFVNVGWSREQNAGLDGVLVHELTHAMRITAGAFSRQATRPVPRTGTSYPNAEELIAETVLNMYLSEAGRGGIYLGYGPSGVPGRLWSRPRGAPPRSSRYADRARYELRAIEEFAHRSLYMKHVFERLAACDYEGYNPFRDWMRGRNPAVVVPESWPRRPRT